MTEEDVAVAAVRAAGQILIGHGRPNTVNHKGRIDLVTEVDLACEEAIRSVLERHTPDIPVHAEESGGAHHATTRWIVDPLDGTTNFVHGFPVYASSVGLLVDGELVAGAILDGSRGDLYRAARGRGAWCGDVQLQVTDRTSLDQSLIATGFPYDRREPGKAAFYLRRVQAVLSRSRGIRRAGSAAMDLVFVASGRLDGFWEYGLSPWDVAAGVLLVEEAGGRVTAHDGAPLALDAPTPLATNGRIHEELSAVLRDAG